MSKLDQCELIINDTLHLSGIPSEEIYHNMWCIGLEDDLIKSITCKELKHVVNRLIENRQQQLKHINFHKNVVFYMWFDQQALQLRFNIISGDETKLPFGCKVQLVNDFESILNNFMNEARDVIEYGGDIQFFDKKDGDHWDEDENEEEYVLNVFAEKLSARI